MEIIKAAKPNLARSAPALGLNCADWASKTASGRPRRSDGRRDGRPDSRVFGRVGTVGAGCYDGRPAWSADRIGRWKSRPDAGVSRLGRSVRRYVSELRGREALLPARALWSCAGGVALWLGRPRVVSRVVMRDRPSGLDFGRDFSRTEWFWPSAEHRSSASRTARFGADSRYGRLEQPSLFWL
ncbi:unnamed protein product [Microthlaspi erraticum]|uniref:Uncharacterized protein n=1 Tax=Microthlaspi erraticum TaxID=1685480 RepID=A0A6D2ISP3_9BRAS|nr:unnamed protein product [Microthlaspi erraticum]